MSRVIRSFRVNSDLDSDIYIKAQKPSGSRMAIHQWPASEAAYDKYATPVAVEIQKLMHPGLSMNLVGKVHIPGVKVRRGCIENGKAEIEIEIGESTSPY